MVGIRESATVARGHEAAGRRHASIVDLRSDGITLPTDEMWEAMRTADVGWALAREDESVLELEALGARLAGAEAGLFVAGGTVGNLVALMTHVGHGEQVVLETSSHILWCEEWAIASICGALPRALHGRRGRINPDELRFAIEEAKLRHRPRTALVCLENTHNMAGGAVLDAAYTAEVVAVARDLGVPVHVDGARIFNACVALGVELAELLRGVDSAVVNLNKALSAPAGAILVGSAGFVERARSNLRAVGGASLHQAGILAAAGLVALRTMVPRLAEDHRRAAALAELLDGLPGLSIDRSSVVTNIVLVDVDPRCGTGEEVVQRLAARNVRVYLAEPQVLRLVTHRHVNDDALARAVDVIRAEVAP